MQSEKWFETMYKKRDCITEEESLDSNILNTQAPSLLTNSTHIWGWLEKSPVSDVPKCTRNNVCRGARPGWTILKEEETADSDLPPRKIGNPGLEYQKFSWIYLKKSSLSTSAMVHKSLNPKDQYFCSRANKSFSTQTG